MSGTADPWEAPFLPAVQSQVERTPTIERTGGPERIYDAANADPTWKPKSVGFTAPVDPPTPAGHWRNAANGQLTYNASGIQPTYERVDPARLAVETEPDRWEGDDS